MLLRCLFCLLLSPIAAFTVAAQSPVATSPAAAQPVPPPPSVPGKAWVLMDHATGRVLAGENIDEQLDPASITKVMTSYVVAAELAGGKLSLDDEVLISERAWREGGARTEGSFTALALNSRVRLEDVLMGLVVQSGNDASIALAEHVAGSEEAFAALMNQHATGLGLVNTHFVNSHGLTAPNHHTSARDIALLSRALISEFPEHYAMYAIKEYTYNGIKQYNRNGLLWKDPSIDGIKTGHTAAAGYCLAASAQRNGQRMISVVLGIADDPGLTPNRRREHAFRQREEANRALLEYGFRFFETHSLYTPAAPVTQPRIWQSTLDGLPLGVSQAVLVTIPRGRYAELQASMDVPRQLVAPIDAGQQVGVLRVKLDGDTVAETALVAMQDAPQAGFFGRSWDRLMMWWDSD